MTVNVYGSLYSPFVQTVLVVLKEADVPYKIVEVNPKKGEAKTPKYLAKHPFGQIPLFEDEDGFTIFESRAICRYIIAKYAPESGLIPKGLKENALFEQGVSIETSNFSPHVIKIGVESLRPTLQGLPVDEALLDEYNITLKDKLEGYEAILSKQKYLAGDTVTLADLLHLPLGSLLVDMLGHKSFDEHPSVKRWWSDIFSRPAWKEIWEESSSKFMEQVAAAKQ